MVYNIIGYNMTKQKKHESTGQGRPRKPDHGNKRLQHKREAWRKASKKYYEAHKTKQKTHRKPRK